MNRMKLNWNSNYQYEEALEEKEYEVADGDKQDLKENDDQEQNFNEVDITSKEAVEAIDTLLSFLKKRELTELEYELIKKFIV